MSLLKMITNCFADDTAQLATIMATASVLKWKGLVRELKQLDLDAFLLATKLQWTTTWLN